MDRGAFAEIGIEERGALKEKMQVVAQKQRLVMYNPLSF